MAWLKLHTDIIDDLKIENMSEKTFKIFVFLLCFAKEINENGAINKTTKEIVWRLRRDENEIKNAIKELVDLNILSNKHGKLSFINWEKRNYSESYKRVTKHRLQKRYSNDESNAYARVTDTDTDTDTDTETDKKKTILSSNGARPLIPYQEIIEDLNSLSGRKFQHNIPATQGLIAARFREGRTLEDFKAVHRNKLAFLKDPEQSRYYRPETLYSAKHFESYLNETIPAATGRNEPPEPTPEETEANEKWAEEFRKRNYPEKNA